MFTIAQNIVRPSNSDTLEMVTEPAVEEEIVGIVNIIIGIMSPLPVPITGLNVHALLIGRAAEIPDAELEKLR